MKVVINIEKKKKYYYRKIKGRKSKIQCKMPKPKTSTSVRKSWREKIRNPVKYLVEKHSVPKHYAQRFLAQPAVIKMYWKEDGSGPYMNKDKLDMIGYGWRKERKEFMESLKSTEKVREVSRKEMKKEYGKILSKKEIGERIPTLPMKYQKRLRRTQRIMKVIS